MKSHIRARLWLLAGVCLAMSASASEVSVPHDFVAGTAAVAAEVNANFQALEAGINDNHQRITGLETAGSDLAKVRYLGWEHAGSIGLGAALSDGLAVWFTSPVQMQTGLQASADVNLMVELYQLSGGSWIKFSDLSFDPLQEVTVDADGLIVSVTVDNSDPALAQGLRMMPGNSLAAGFYRLVLRGDFILDETGRALDGNFLGADLPSGDAVEGGTFETWFSIDA